MLASTPSLAALRLVLASASPRRVELIRDNLGLVVEVCPSRFEENLCKSDYADAAAYCQETARRKAEEVAARCCSRNCGRAQLVIAADTVVSLAGRVLEKPRDADHAFAMLRELSESDHQVVTAVAFMLVPAEGDQPVREHAFTETTRVRFSKLSDSVINDYIQSGEPMDKAGAYGIQGRGGAFVQRIEGCYFNVVGLPLNRFCSELTTFLGSEQQ